MTTQPELIPGASAEAKSGAAVRVQPLVRCAVALSIRQPWAWLIIHAGKDIENRSWPTHRRGRVLVHASKGMTRAEYEAAYDFVRCDVDSKIAMPTFESLQRGGVIGEVEIADCVTCSKSPWFCGPYGFVLKNPKPLPFHPFKGALGFFVCDYV